MSNYELTNQTMEYDGIELYRIRAVQDFENQGGLIRAGTLGGWVESYHNLQGNAWIADEAKVWGDACVTDQAQVSDKVEVYGSAKICGRAFVTDNARIHDDAVVKDCANICDYAHIHGSAVVSGLASILGHSRVSGHAKVSEWGQVNGYARVEDDSRVHGNARVHGYAHVFGQANICGDTELFDKIEIFNNAFLESNKDYTHLNTTNENGLSSTATMFRTWDNRVYFSLYSWRGFEEDPEEIFSNHGLVDSYRYGSMNDWHKKLYGMIILLHNL